MIKTIEQQLEQLKNYLAQFEDNDFSSIYSCLNSQELDELTQKVLTLGIDYIYRKVDGFDLSVYLEQIRDSHKIKSN